MKDPFTASVVQFRARHFVVVVVKIPAVWRVAIAVWQDVLDFDTPVNSCQRDVLVMEGRASLVVNDSRGREVRFPRVLALLPTGDGALYSVGGLVASVLDEIGV